MGRWAPSGGGGGGEVWGKEVSGSASMWRDGGGGGGEGGSLALSPVLIPTVRKARSGEIHFAR